MKLFIHSLAGGKGVILRHMNERMNPRGRCSVVREGTDVILPVSRLTAITSSTGGVISATRESAACAWHSSCYKPLVYHGLILITILCTAQVGNDVKRDQRSLESAHVSDSPSIKARRSGPHKAQPKHSRPIREESGAPALSRPPGPLALAFSSDERCEEAREAKGKRRRGWEWRRKAGEDAAGAQGQALHHPALRPHAALPP